MNNLLRFLSTPSFIRFAGGLKRRALWAVDSAKLAPDMNAMKERYQTIRQTDRDGSFRLGDRDGERGVGFFLSPIVVVVLDRFSSANVGNPPKGASIYDVRTE